MVLKGVNLNLVPTLRELLRLKSVSGAADILGRSPAAVSESLANLRVVLDDPLLVRAGGGMVLTPRAAALINEVDAACTAMERVFAEDSFDPTALERLIVIAAHDFHVVTFGPRLVDLFTQVAPRFTLRFVNIGRDLPELMAERAVDLALMPDFHVEDMASANLLHTWLSDDPTVLMMRAGHPLASQSGIDRAHLHAYPHIVFQPTWEAAVYRRGISHFREDLPIKARVAQIVLLPFFLGDTDNVALVPKGLAERMGPALNLVHRRLHIEVPLVRSVIAWSQVQDVDKVHRWYRQLIARGLGPAD